MDQKDGFRKDGRSEKSCAEAEGFRLSVANSMPWAANVTATLNGAKNRGQGIQGQNSRKTEIWNH